MNSNLVTSFLSVSRKRGLLFFSVKVGSLALPQARELLLEAQNCVPTLSRPRNDDENTAVNKQVAEDRLVLRANASN